MTERVFVSRTEVPVNVMKAVKESRRAQGLPEKVTDPLVLARIVAIIAQANQRKER